MSEITYHFKVTGADDIVESFRRITESIKSAAAATVAGGPRITDALCVEVNGSLLAESVDVSMKIERVDGKPCRMISLLNHRPCGKPPEFDFDKAMATGDSFEVRLFWCGSGLSATSSKCAVVEYEAASGIDRTPRAYERVVISAPYQPFS